MRYEYWQEGGVARGGGSCRPAECAASQPGSWKNSTAGTQVGQRGGAAAQQQAAVGGRWGVGKRRVVVQAAG